MSTRLLLEGGDLAELMVHVRAEFGPTARIIRAERVRSGGLAGFFARQRYELTVDVPDEPLARPRAMRAAGTAAAAGTAVAAAGADQGLVGLEALLAAADAAEVGGALTPSPVPAVPQVSTGAESFASVLDQVREMAGAHTPHADVFVPAPADRVFEPLVPAAVPAVPAVLPAPPPPAVLPAPPPPAVPARPGASRAALVELGVPSRILDGSLPDPAPLSLLLASIPPAPELVRAPGSVLVVVGPARDAENVATQLAERLRQAPTAIVLAGNGEGATGGGTRLTSVFAVERWRVRGADRGEVTVVVLGCGPSRLDRQDTADLLVALQPDQVWGVVDARTKTRDSHQWLADVGARRRVDALAVRGLFDTAQPGTVLDLGVPVAWFDGIPATRVAWAAVLSERLGPAASWD